MFLGTALRTYTRKRKHERKFIPHILGVLGNRELRNVKPWSLVLYQHKRYRGGAAKSTINKELQLILRVLRKHGFDFPVYYVYRDEKRKRPLLTAEQWQRLLAASRQSPNWLRARAAAVLAAWLGMDEGELREITWEGVDPWREVLAWRGMEYTFTDEVRDVLIELELSRQSATGRCRETDRLLNFRSWKDAWKAMTAAAELRGIYLSDVAATFRTEQPPSLASA